MAGVTYYRGGGIITNLVNTAGLEVIKSGAQNVDARLNKAVAGGAKICKDPFDIPGVGRMAVLAEPGGAVVAWMTPKP